ncbi:MAG: SAF domain-containing protein, partial [Flavobacteriaceae bacterium]
KRGMIGPDHPGHIDELTGFYNIDELRAKGPIVDYALRSVPGPGVYVMASCDDQEHKEYLDLYKLGKGPLYSFYTPYHLCYFEVPNSIARVAISRDSIISPIGRPYVDVVAIAKKDLSVGEQLDGIGGFSCYGVAENSTTTFNQRLLPMGQIEGVVVKRAVSKGSALTVDDVRLPEGRICDSLREEQNALFASELGKL